MFMVLSGKYLRGILSLSDYALNYYYRQMHQFYLKIIVRQEEYCQLKESP